MIKRNCLNEPVPLFTAEMLNVQLTYERSAEELKLGKTIADLLKSKRVKVMLITGLTVVKYSTVLFQKIIRLLPSMITIITGLN